MHVFSKPHLLYTVFIMPKTWNIQLLKLHTSHRIFLERLEDAEYKLIRQIPFLGASSLGSKGAEIQIISCKL